VRFSALSALFFVVALRALSAGTKSTDAARDGFKGAVKSVTTERQVVSPEPRQPDGPTVIYPAGCEVCDYDEDGNSVRRGQNREAGFVGETTRYVRDRDGNIQQQIVENEKGELNITATVGQFGKTEEEFYQHGVLQSTNKYRYDEKGNLIEWLTYDRDGGQTARTIATFDSNGTATEQFDYGPQGKVLLHYTQSYDPETDMQKFTNFNEDGTVRLAFTAKGERVTSFWQQPSDKDEFGSTVCSKTGCESHQPDGSLFRTVTTFADADSRNIARAERHDTDDQLQAAVDYEYEFDEHANWTKRSVWVWTRESSERVLLEVDSRRIAYWK